MPVSPKQLRWAFATHQPFARRWADQVKVSGYETRRRKAMHSLSKLRVRKS
jgi:hypothetical protein